MISSDQYITYVCERCGMLKHEGFCNVCNTNNVCFQEYLFIFK